MTQCLDCQQSVIDSTEAGPSHDHRRQLQLRDQFQDIDSPRQGHMYATYAFNEHKIMPRAEGANSSHDDREAY
jgi:hypothetical protein